MQAFRRPLALALAVAAVLLVSACHQDAVEEFQKAAKALGEARQDLEQAREAEAEKAKALEKAREEHTAAQQTVRDAERHLAEVESQVDLKATDDVLFRLVQSTLLEDKDLEGVAIRASVEKGVVTLSGVVPNPKLRDRAIAVASKVPGVARVESQITVPAPPPAEG